MKTNDALFALPQLAVLARRRVCLWGGHLFLGMGFVGMLLPVMPTTVFWIIAATCYAKSSPERYYRLIGHGRTGQVIRNYLDHGVIPARGKWLATFSMSLSALILWLLPMNELAKVLGLLGLGVGAVFVLTRPGEAKITPAIDRVHRQIDCDQRG